MKRAFLEVSHWPEDGLQMACFWTVADGVFLDRPVHTPLPQKDAPTPIRHRVQFIASKTSTRWSYGDSVILLFYCLFLPFTLTCRICDFGPSLKKPSHKKMRQPESATVSNYQRIKTLSVGVTADSSNSPFFCLFLSSPILACVPCPCP